MTSSTDNSLFSGRRIRQALAGAALLVGTAAVAAAVPEFYGFLGTSDASDEQHTPGWYRLHADGEWQQIWQDRTFGATAPYFTSGWLRNDRLCGGFGNRSQWFYLEFDPLTGEHTGQREIDVEGPNAVRYMYTAAFNTLDGYVYGFSYNASMTQDYFVKCPSWDLEAVEIIREMPDDYVLCASFCYNPTDNHFYGVDPYGWLIRVDTNGNFQALEEVEYDHSSKLANWSSGMVYSPRDNAFYWNAQMENFDSLLVRIDAETYEFETVLAYPPFDLYTFLYSIEDDREEAGLDAPQIQGSTLTGGAAFGKISYLMPSGSNLPASLAWEASDNRNIVKTGTAAPGELVEVEWESLSEGEHTLSMRVVADGVKGASAWTNIWVGGDEPDRVKNVLLGPSLQPGKVKISWDAVTAGTHGGYVDPAELVYAVFDGDKQLLATRATSVEIEVDPSWIGSKLKLMVVAVYQGMISDPTYSNELLVGDGFPLPYNAAPTLQDWESMTTVNAAGSHSAWTTKTDFSGLLSLYIPTSGDTAADDWVFTPALLIEDASVKQEFSLMAGGNSNVKKDEYLEVWVGKAADPAAMTIPVVGRTQVGQIAQTEIKGRAGVGEPGAYYMGIRCVSNPGMSGVYVNRISVTDTDESSVGTLGQAEASIFGVKGGIALFDMAGREISVVAADGRTVARAVVAGDREILPLPKGLYIVSGGSAAVKVNVR